MVLHAGEKECPLCGVVDKAEAYFDGEQYRLKVDCKNPMCIGNRLDLKK